MKKLIVLGLAGLLSLPVVSVAQKRTTTTKKKTTTTTAKSSAATAAQEKARQEELARQQQEAAASQRSQQLLAKSDSANPSARPIPASDVMFKKTVWRLIDLREKQNKPMFSPGKEITKLIVDAVKRGELQPYATDSLNRPITPQEFLAAISPDQGGATALTEEEKKAGFGTADVATDDGWGAPATPAKGGKTAAAAAPMTASNELFANQLYQMELKEDVIFDKKRSRLYHDIQAISITVPSKYNALGIEKPAASFKYSELAKVFKAHPDEALWFNQQNDAQHKNLSDAFDLWLFSSYITKVSNVGNERLDEVYGSGKKGLLAAQQAMEELIEFEYSLWSY
ncbi:gliding motility protein GldN [Rufibacter sp. DG15C]|uniref:type IX secretion system ring protein PorN/GldN n=1 Tax=Rufibacter sp. DG15C TaxID=1379909 RepID=UPI0009EA22AA|nr:gliding motility protein GldN [Rufibacter sp. DG15C]